MIFLILIGEGRVFARSYEDGDEEEEADNADGLLTVGGKRTGVAIITYA